VPSHPIARGRAGPSLLAHILFSKYGLHLPLNLRARSTRARASSSMSRRSPIGPVASAAMLMPLVDAMRDHVFAAERIHADDSVLQKHTERMIEMI
jgi:transposase